MLGEGKVMRFNELHKSIGDISQKMLTVTLKKLEADGLIKRELFAEVPPRVEYTLTGRGTSLLPHIDGLAAWAAANVAVIKDSRKKYETVG
jgi:DNA-binding HxlR family transcriptional regulator